MIIKYFRISLLLTLMLLSGQAISDDASWLYGNWLLTYDPDGDTQDRLTFTEENKFTTTEVATGKQFNGMYAIRGNTIYVSLLVNGKVFYKFELTFDDNKNKLYYKAKDSSTISYYTKVK